MKILCVQSLNPIRKILRNARDRAPQTWLLKCHFDPNQYFYKAKMGVFGDKMAINPTPFIEMP